MQFSTVASLLLIFCCTIFVDRASGQGGVTCPVNDAFIHNNYYYQYFDCPLPWRRAEAACTSQMRYNGQTLGGGHLVSVLNPTESDWLQGILQQRYGLYYGIWIGLRRGPHNGGCPNNFAWTDGSSYSYAPWVPNQPSCRWPGEDCIHLMNDFYRWNDAECQMPMRFMCKAPVTNFDVGGSP